MASNIISETIDGAYPVAGVDNDTQGFRNNFSIIKNNFAAAKSEIETLQESTAKLNETNNFRGSNINEANFQAVTEQHFPIGGLAPLQTGVNIDFRNGHYHTLVIDSANVTLNLVGWPDAVLDADSTKVAKFTVELRGAGTSPSDPRTITWTTRGGGAGTKIKTSSNFPTPFTVDNNVEDPVIVEFWSYNGGTTVYANYLGRFE
jgi:hypothetical protein